MRLLYLFSSKDTIGQYNGLALSFLLKLYMLQECIHCKIQQNLRLFHQISSIHRDNGAA